MNEKKERTPTHRIRENLWKTVVYNILWTRRKKNYNRRHLVNVLGLDENVRQIFWSTRCNLDLFCEFSV